VAVVAGALSLPIVSQHLHAQDKPAGPPPGPAPVAAAPAAPMEPNKVIASAGKFTVTAGEFDNFILSLSPQDRQQLAAGGPEARKQVADHLLKLKALKQEAERRKLDQDPKVKEQVAQVEKVMKAQMEAARTNILIQSLLAPMQADEAADKKYFDEHPEQFGQIKARHILVSTQGGSPSEPKPKLTDEQAKKKADDIRARLVKGEDFAALVKAESDDTESKASGGEYTFPRGKMVAAFEQTAFGLKPKEISQPVKTPFGYHVIQLLERLPGTYEQSRDLITPRRFEAYITSLVGGETKVEDSFLKAAAAAPQPGPPAGPGAAGQQPQPSQPAPRPQPAQPKAAPKPANPK
jgi:peptidyl-prolyl cis-trans isomerase C